jgi:hypothetical protein
VFALSRCLAVTLLGVLPPLAFVVDNFVTNP